MKRRKEETGIGREESERRKVHRQLILFLASFFQTNSLSPSPSLYFLRVYFILCSFGLSVCLPLSVSLSFPVSFYVSSTSKSLFSSFIVSISKSLSNSVRSSVFLFSLSICLPLSNLPLHSLFVSRLYLLLYYLSPSLSLFSVFVSSVVLPLSHILNKGDKTKIGR